MKSANLLASLILAAALHAAGSAFAQEVDVRDVSLVLQDFSDCANADVSAADLSLVGGTVSVQRRPDHTTVIMVDLAAQPNTTYHFFLKCVRLLGDLTTDAGGFVSAVLRFRTEETGNIFAFDVYPEGAPSGNKFQSVQVNYRDPPPPVVLSPRIEYVTQVGDRVSFAYEDLPTGSEVVLVDVMTGSAVDGLNVPLNWGGRGSAEITVPGGGTYYLRAQGQADKNYIAQTIKFYGY
jgi:hypothetical protein